LIRLRRLVSWCTAEERRWFVLAVVVAFGLRLAWVLWVGAVEPLEATSDAGRNLTMARQFSMLETYRLDGLVSAFNPPGYSFLLTPVALLSRWTGWFGLPLGAAVVNVVSGTATAALGGVLAGQWFGRRSRTAAAWVLAVAAGPIYLTVVGLTETTFTALVVLVLVLLSRYLLVPEARSRWLLVGIGALIGFVALIRGPGLLLVAVALVVVRQACGSWRTATRPGLAVAGVAVLMILPWTVRNAVQVGAYTPIATNSAAFACQGHGERARADVQDMSEEDFAYCFRQSPFDPVDHDEGAWASRISRRALSWAVRHPAEEVELTWDKTYATLVNDHQALADAADGGRRELVSSTDLDRLDRLGELWHRAVLLLGAASLVLLAAARRAWPLWVTAAGFVAVVWAGNALDRYHHPTMAILAVLAGGLLGCLPETAPWAWAEAGVGRLAVRRAEGADALARQLAAADAPPPPAEEGLAVAATPGRSSLGRPGPPAHPFLASIAIAAWVAASGFDLGSQVAEAAWTYARGAYVLTGLGVGAGLLAAAAGTLDLRRVPRGTVAFRTGLRHLVLMDAAILVFALSFVLRRRSDFAVDEAVSVLPMALGAAGLVVVAVGAWHGRRLAHGYGVGVAAGADRRQGFEPEEDSGVSG
jgi:uncharacterized membrane protein